MAEIKETYYLPFNIMVEKLNELKKEAESIAKDYALSALTGSNKKEDTESAHRYHIKAASFDKAREVLNQYCVDVKEIIKKTKKEAAHE
jgi:hypothetical protein